MHTSRHIYQLSDINGFVRDIIDAELPDSYWVEAEIAELNERGGHCYITLIEKDEHSNTPVARASARCWRNVWGMVKSHFLQVTGTTPRAGMKVLVLAHAEFHEAYGFSWIITDIDPTYTLGDLARRRQQIIARLKEEGVFDLNRQLTLSPFAQNIAVISSASAAGYGDFIDQLQHNTHGFVFHTQLFPAVMQGEQVEQSVIQALSDIYDSETLFDAVVIIRGGGSTADLSGFDTLPLAEHVANFPLPVITGIGHDRDESVLDLIAHTRVKTPTAAAEMLVANLLHTWTIIDEAGNTIARTVRQRMEHERMRLAHLSATLPLVTQRTVEQQVTHISRLSAQLHNAVREHISTQQHHIAMIDAKMRTALLQRTEREQHRLTLLVQQVKAHDPQRLLNKGYSITTHNGHAVKDTAQLRKGDILQTRTAKGTVISTVETVKGK